MVEFEDRVPKYLFFIKKAFFNERERVGKRMLSFYHDKTARICRTTTFNEGERIHTHTLSLQYEDTYIVV